MIFNNVRNFANSTTCVKDKFNSYVAFSEGHCIEANTTDFKVTCSGRKYLLLRLLLLILALPICWHLTFLLFSFFLKFVYLFFFYDCTEQVTLMEYAAGSKCTGTEKSINAPQVCHTSAFKESDDGVYNPDFIQPPPSVSTTVFPTMAHKPNSSEYAYCQVGNTPSAEPTAQPTAPSAKPSPRPSTAYPTSAAASTVAFNAAQTIDGISESTYNSQVTEYTATLKQSIAESMIGVLAENVINLVVISAPNSAAKFSAFSSHKLRTTATSAIYATYTVSVPTTMTYSDLTSQLDAAVTSGQFTTQLQHNAGVFGATGFATASSSSVAITAVPSDSSSSSSDLSTGAIIGIAVGGFCGLLIIGFVVYYLIFLNSVPLAKQPNLEL